jgi:phosphomevalonate kinase
MPVNPVRLTVPGNILLLGEYAVLEEGGLGVAMAVDTRVRLEASPAESLLIEAMWAGRTISWTPERRGESLLIDAAVDAVTERLGRSCEAKIHLDSSDFFSPDGRKAGLGSSAAVSVALVCGLLHSAGEGSAARGEAPLLALQAHRRAQGGRGSGYDVMTSFHGGCGLFRGGADPGWDPCTLPADPRVLLFAGPAPVSTADAVRSYMEWKECNSAAAQDFLRESNNAIMSFVQAGSDVQALLWFGACRELGIELGRSIRVPAEMPVPQGLDPLWCKATGAGSELGLCLVPPGVPVPADREGLRLVRRADTGVTWEE